MQHKRHVSTGVAVVGLMLIVGMGCAMKRDPATLRAMTERRDDPYRQATIYQGARAGAMQLWALLPYDRSKPEEYGLAVDVGHFNKPWRFFEQALDREGTSLKLYRQPPRVQCGRVGCFKDEPVVVMISRPYLEAHRFQGLDIKLIGRGGSDVYQLPGSYVEAFLASLPRDSADYFSTYVTEGGQAR